MRNDQIFVLLLVILLPMSGCFDGAVGDAEGSEEVVPATTEESQMYHMYTESNETNVANISVNSNQIPWDGLPLHTLQMKHTYHNGSKTCHLMVKPWKPLWWIKRLKTYWVC